MKTKTITQISENKKNSDRVSIYADDEFLFSCHKELVYRKSLKKGDQIDPKLLSEIAREDEYIKGKDAALRFIERSIKTVKQVEDKLREKGYSEETIERIIALLHEYKLLNDLKYAETFLKEKLRSRGIKKARFELMQKGIGKETMDQAIESLSTASVEEESCMKLAEKKYEQLKKREPDAYKLKNKLYSFLVGKGYDYDLINSTLRELIQNDD